MKRPNTILTNKPADFILVDEDERELFGVPAVLSTEEGLVTAFGLHRVTRSIYKRGHAKTDMVSEDNAIDLLGVIEAETHRMEGEMLKERSAALIAFASNIIDHLTREELLALQGPASDYLDAQYGKSS